LLTCRISVQPEGAVIVVQLTTQTILICARQRSPLVTSPAPTTMPRLDAAALPAVTDEWNTITGTGVFVGVEVCVGVAVNVGVGVLVDRNSTPGTGTSVAVKVGVAVGVWVGVSVGVVVGVD